MSLTGQTISHYQIIEQLGAGGMGVVYKAHDSRLDRLVALKFLPTEFSSDAEAKQRFVQEAKAASALDHSNICTVHDIGSTEDGRLFIVMPAYDGKTLKYRIQDGSLGVEKSVDVARQIAKGLARAHEAGIVHRDIKPANIMVTDRGEVKILDFGVAKLEQGIDITKTGTTLGTVWYMSPEQTRGETVDARSDLWSLGVVFFEMLAGRRPFVGDYDQAVAYSILNSDPDSVSDLNAEVTEHVADVVRRLLEKGPDKRFQNASEVVDALGSHGEAVAHKPHIGTEASKKGERRRVSAFTAVVGTIVSILILAIFSYTMMDSEPPDASVAVISDDALEPGVEDVAKLAVLPFSNMRPDPETDFLGYALADQVIGTLSYIQDLTVRPSNSVRKYQHGDYDLNEVKDQLAVNYVLAGNYLHQGNKMRLTVELIDLNTEETMWREPIEVAYEDAFEMQDLVSERLLTRLEVSFSDAERDGMTADVSKDPLAYEYYLRSLPFPEEADGNRLAVDMLLQSIGLDSTFAPAWAALGRREQIRAYWQLGGDVVLDRAEGYLLKALDLNPELLSALQHLTLLYTDTGKTDLAMETARRALEINLNSAEGLFAYGYVLQYSGMLEESAIAMDRALELDPTNPTFRSAAWTFVHSGRYEDAITTFRLGPLDLAVAWEGEIAIREGRPAEARAKLAPVAAADPDGILGLWAIGLMSALDGDYARGIEAARKWENADLSDGQGWYYLAGQYCINQAVDKCIAILDEAVDRGYFAYPHMLHCRFLDSARGNPDLDAVLEKARVKHEAFKAKFF